MRKFLSQLLALGLVFVLGLTGCAASPSGLTGNYRQDTLTAIEVLRTAIDLPADSPNKTEVQTQARLVINDYVSRYRRNDRYLKLTSFSTMSTALNSLAGHYSSYPNRPIPQKLHDRLDVEFNRVEIALKREE